MLSIQMAQHLHNIRRNMNASTHPLKRPSLFVNSHPETLALQQSSCSGSSKSCSNDRNSGSAIHVQWLVHQNDALCSTRKSAGMSAAGVVSRRRESVMLYER